MADERQTYDVNEYVKEAIVTKITKRSGASLRLDRHLKRGIPYSKFGNTILYRVGDVYTFLERCKVTPGEDQAGATA
jgi:hypothetical protein